MRSGGLYLWVLIGGFLVGVAARSFLPLGLSFAGFAALLALTAPFFARSVKSALVVCLTLFAFSGGVVRMDVAVFTGDPHLTAHLGESVTIEGVVIQEPDVRDSSTRVSIAAGTLITKYAKDEVYAGVLVQAPPHSDVTYGDHVRAYGTLRVPEAFDTGEGRRFNYPEYLAAQGIEYQLS